MSHPNIDTFGVESRVEQLLWLHENWVIDLRH